MASYTALNATRDTVTLVLSRAEATALRDLALYAESNIDDVSSMKPQTRAAGTRATDALSASLNTSARRCGFFD